MRSAFRSVGLAVVSLGLLGLGGCAENNEANVVSESAGKTTAAPITAQDYNKMGTNPTTTKAPQGYPGAAKASGAGAQAPP